MGYLFDVLPTRTANDPMDGALVDAEFCGQFDRVRFAVARSAVAAANFCDLLFGEFAAGYAATASTIRRLTVTRSALADFVLRVVVGRPNEKVCGVDARRVVALVANEHSIGDRSTPQLPSVSMSPHRLVSMKFEQAVTGSAVFGGEPNPATVRAGRLVDMGIKPLGGRRYSWGHHRAPISVVGPRLLAAARGHFVPEIIAASGA